MSSMLTFTYPNGTTKCMINSAAIAMVVPNSTSKTLKITLVTGEAVMVLGDLNTLPKNV